MGSGLHAADTQLCIIQFLMEIFVFCILKTNIHKQELQNS